MRLPNEAKEHLKKEWTDSLVKLLEIFNIPEETKKTVLDNKEAVYKFLKESETLSFFGIETVETDPTSEESDD